jgi:hypothetical protein
LPSRFELEPSKGEFVAKASFAEGNLYDLPKRSRRYLQFSGIAAIEIGADGEVTVRETVDTEASSEVISICCMAGDASRLAALAHRCSGDQAAVARQLRQLRVATSTGVSNLAKI